MRECLVAACSWKDHTDPLLTYDLGAGSTGISLCHEKIPRCDVAQKVPQQKEPRKAAFLREAVRVTGANAAIHAIRVSPG